MVGKGDLVSAPGHAHLLPFFVQVTSPPSSEALTAQQGSWCVTSRVMTFEAAASLLYAPSVPCPGHTPSLTWRRAGFSPKAHRDYIPAGLVHLGSWGPLSSPRNQRDSTSAKGGKAREPCYSSPPGLQVTSVFTPARGNRPFLGRALTRQKRSKGNNGPEKHLSQRGQLVQKAVSAEGKGGLVSGSTVVGALYRTHLMPVPCNMSLIQELSSVRERLQDLGWDLCPLHDKGDADTAAAIQDIMSALIQQEKALAILVDKLEEKTWGGRH